MQIRAVRHLTLLVLLLLPLGSIAFAEDTTYRGEFVHKQDNRWVELGPNGEKRFDFVETSRAPWSVQLTDHSRNLSIRIDLWANEIYFRYLNTSQEYRLYKVMSPADRSVSGHLLSRVSFAGVDQAALTVATPNGWNGLRGYLAYHVENTGELSSQNAGLGFYASVWPLINKPLRDFQIGLPSVWVTPDNRDNASTPLCPEGTLARTYWPERGPTYADVYQTMEGGVGYWAGNHFKNGTPKFSINGTSQCYDYEIATPGFSFFTSTAPLPDHQLGIAQLSNRILLPPDAMPFGGNPNGEVIGYSWMSLPLADATYTGEFIQKPGTKSWTMLTNGGSSKTDFIETHRDAWSVYLRDPSNVLGIQLDLWKNEVYWWLLSRGHSTKSAAIYSISKPSDHSVSGWAASRVYVGAVGSAVAQGQVPTGDNSWTLFVNAANFKGPVAYYAPEAWSRIAALFKYDFDIGRGLDAKMASPRSGGGAMELNTVPYFTATAQNNEEYVKIPPLYFPTDENNRSVLVRDLKVYSKSALYDAVQTWRRGGQAPNGSFVDAGMRARFGTGPASYKHKDHPIRGINEAATPAVFDNGRAWGIQWQNNGVSAAGQFPHYFKRSGDGYLAVSRHEVPKETGLLEKTFAASSKGPEYSASISGAWAVPGATHGSYTANLNDGSTITYKWYRFVDQPSLQQFGFSQSKKAQLQAFVEKIHREWTIDRNYMEPPTSGRLVSLDDGLIVSPPPGLEYGYVPIVVQQR